MMLAPMVAPPIVEHRELRLAVVVNVDVQLQFELLCQGQEQGRLGPRAGFAQVSKAWVETKVFGEEHPSGEELGEIESQTKPHLLPLCAFVFIGVVNERTDSA